MYVYIYIYIYREREREMYVHTPARLHAAVEDDEEARLHDLGDSKDTLAQDKGGPSKGAFLKLMVCVYKQCIIQEIIYHSGNHLY